MNWKYTNNTKYYNRLFMGLAALQYADLTFDGALWSYLSYFFCRPKKTMAIYPHHSKNEIKGHVTGY